MFHITAKFGDVRWNPRTQSFETHNEEVRHYKYEEQQMSKLDQLKKDYEAMGETIKKMEDEEKAVWTADDIFNAAIDGVNIKSKSTSWKFKEAIIIIHCPNGKTCNTYFVLHGNQAVNEKSLDKHEMADYLNENGYKKA
jgi:hypothetical protein